MFKHGESRELLQVELFGRLSSKHGRVLTEHEMADIYKFGIKKLKNRIKYNETARHTESGDNIQGSFDDKFFKPFAYCIQ